MINLEPIIGVYQLQYDNMGNLIAGIAGVDFTYIFKALVLVVTLMSVFVMLNGIIRRGHR